MKLLSTLKRTSITLTSVIALCCVAPVLAGDPPLTATVGYINMPQLPPGADQINPVRYAAIQTAATSLGARGGLAWEARNINATLQSESVFLDQVFDFNQLLLGHNVLPPVLIEGSDSLNLDDDDTLRIAAQTYRIIRPARFVTAPPNWRDYLWMRFDKPKLVDRSLLPQTHAEAALWNHFVDIAWREGCQQADDIFTSNLNHLQRDMLGMILYRKLLAEHMVSAPFVAKAQLGVTGDATQMRINDEVMRITAQSELQPNPKKWTPIITK